VLSSLLSKQVVNVLFTPGTLVDAAGDQGIIDIGGES
jgi:hypothetical protein